MSRKLAYIANGVKLSSVRPRTHIEKGLHIYLNSRSLPQLKVAQEAPRRLENREKRADDALLALLAGGAGGAGGWALGKKYLQPYFADKERALAEAIAKQQKQMGMWSRLGKNAPAGAAIGGAAILIAALALAKARRDEKERQYLQQVLGPIQSYDQTGAGFSAQNQMPFNTAYGPGGFYG